jgi:FAD/FMN-containing dehydrogenase
MAAAHAHSMVVVTGNCQSVALAGGYAQGGGHGQLASRFGLGADQVIEWSIVTASGEVVTATPAQHDDVYWALCGGGGGTFGVVLGAVVKLYPELRTASAMLRFSLSKEDALVEGTRARFWDAVQMFVVDTLPLLDIGGMAIWSVGTTPSLNAHDVLSFAAHPVVLPGGNSSSLHGRLTATPKLMEQYGMAYGACTHTPSDLDNRSARYIEYTRIKQNTIPVPRSN